MLPRTKLGSALLRLWFLRQQLVRRIPAGTAINCRENQKAEEGATGDKPELESGIPQKIPRDSPSGSTLTSWSCTPRLSTRTAISSAGSKDNFKVFEDGVEQNIASFSHRRTFLSAWDCSSI